MFNHGLWNRILILGFAVSTYLLVADFAINAAWAQSELTESPLTVDVSENLLGASEHQPAFTCETGNDFCTCKSWEDCHSMKRSGVCGSNPIRPHRRTCAISVKEICLLELATIWRCKKGF